jgi:hypothetical protein
MHNLKLRGVSKYLYKPPYKKRIWMPKVKMTSYRCNRSCSLTHDEQAEYEEEEEDSLPFYIDLMQHTPQQLISFAARSHPWYRFLFAFSECPGQIWTIDDNPGRITVLIFSSYSQISVLDKFINISSLTLPTSSFVIIV